MQIKTVFVNDKSVGKAATWAQANALIAIKGIRFAETPLAGMSILQYAGSSEGANAYRNLAKAVIKREPASPAPEVTPAEQPVATRA